MIGMVTITIVLLEKASKALARRAEPECKSVEELIGEAALKQLNVADPDAKVELHLKLCEKYMREADDFIAKKDYVQASEKAWGAASQIVKAVAAKEGKKRGSHAALWDHAIKLAYELKDPS